MDKAQILAERLNIDLACRVDTVERLFCAAILTQGVDTATDILDEYRRMRDLLGVKSERAA